mmetsp:Transcript_29482/g.66069  ORF Transcript_29482/g.66069 Transcript_29482/m.66069 type:complete len:376 (-) Transcript_29482:547-1674(-)
MRRRVRSNAGWAAPGGEDTRSVLSCRAAILVELKRSAIEARCSRCRRRASWSHRSSSSSRLVSDALCRASTSRKTLSMNCPRGFTMRCLPERRATHGENVGRDTKDCPFFPFFGPRISRSGLRSRLEGKEGKLGKLEGPHPRLFLEHSLTVRLSLRGRLCDHTSPVAEQLPRRRRHGNTLLLQSLQVLRVHVSLLVHLLPELPEHLVQQPAQAPCPFHLRHRSRPRFEALQILRLPDFFGESGPLGVPRVDLAGSLLPPVPGHRPPQPRVALLQMQSAPGKHLLLQRPLRRLAHSTFARGHLRLVHALGQVLVDPFRSFGLAASFSSKAVTRKVHALALAGLIVFAPNRLLAPGVFVILLVATFGLARLLVQLVE